MAEANEQSSFLSLGGSDSGLTLVNTDAFVRKIDQQNRQNELKNKQIAKLEEKIEELQDIVEIYKEKLNWVSESTEESATLWTPNLVDADKENVIANKGANLIVEDANASHGAESDSVISIRNDDTGKKVEKHVKKTDDAIQTYSSFSEDRLGDPSESSCTSEQSVMEYEGIGAEEIQRKISFVRSLAEENEELKRKMRLLCIENEKLATECTIMSKEIAYKENEVLELKDHISDLEGHVELLQGQFGVLGDQDKLLLGHFSEVNCRSAPAFSDGSSLKRSSCMKRNVFQIKSMFEEEEGAITTVAVANEEIDDCSEGIDSATSEERMEVITEEECCLMDDDTLTDYNFLEHTLTEEEILMEFEGSSSDPIAQRTAERKSNVEESGIFSEKEVSCHSDSIASDDMIATRDDGTVKNDGRWKKNGYKMEAYAAMEEKDAKKDCSTQQERDQKDAGKDQETVKREKKGVLVNDGGEGKARSPEREQTRNVENQADVAAIENNTRMSDENTNGMKNGKKDNTASKGEEIKQYGGPGRYNLTKFIQQVWSIIGGGRQIEDVSMDGSNFSCDDDQVAKVSRAIWELKEENSELYLAQYEMKEVVEFLNAEATLIKEELNDMKRGREELEEEKDALVKMCRELKDKCQVLEVENLNIYATCQDLEEKHQLAECFVKDMEQKSLEKEEKLLKIEGEYRNLQQEKNDLELKAKDTVELEKKVNFWSGICGKLYSFLKKDNAEMAKVEEKCEKLSKLARKERSHRKKIERRNKKMLKKDKIRSEILCRRARLSNRICEKMLHLQIEIERLQAENINLKADRKGFEGSYKSEIVFSAHLKNEIAGLESRIKLFEETLDRRTRERNNVLLEKKWMSQELERVRKVKREHKRRADEIAEERGVIAMQIKRHEGMIADAKEKVKEKDMLLNMYKSELDKIAEHLKVEADKRHLLELSAKEEKKIRASFEQRLSESILELSEANGRLEEAMKTNEELENAIEAQQQQPVKSSKKQGIFRRWFRGKKRKPQ